jgi:DNA primase
MRISKESIETRSLAYDTCVRACSYLLNNFPGAAKYKEYLGGRLNNELQQKFQFGYFPSQDQLNVLISEIGAEDLKSVELIYEKLIGIPAQKIIVSPLENHNLIMPYKDLYGNIVGIVGRSLSSDPSTSKYKNTKFAKDKNLFALNYAEDAIVENDFCYIVEGQFDAISLHSININNAVAVGSANLSIYQIALLLRYTQNIHLLFDNDEAGMNAREKIVKKYSSYANIKNVYVPDDYKDVDEYIKHCGANVRL